jgi:hypothetical protein
VAKQSARLSQLFWEELCDLAKAIGLGIVRSGDKRSAHLRAVPAGYDAKPKGLFCLNVTRRKVLHGAHAFGLAFDLLSSAGAWSCRDAFCKEGLSDSFVRSFDPNSYRFLDELVASSRIALSRLVFGRSRSHLRSEQEYFLEIDNLSGESAEACGDPSKRWSTVARLP